MSKHFVERGVTAFKKLVKAAKELNEARDELRIAASRLAGCDLSSWKFSDIQKYVDLGYEQHPLSPYRQAVELLKTYAKAIEEASATLGHY
jgi:hypothetical protein